ncbi:MAG: protein kinase domain-containing protein [Actinomycetota bacterium]
MNATTLAGRYVLIERIAAGGMGSVHKATDERLGRTVAVKLLRDELAGDPRFVERFRREARAVAALSHPNIAGVFDYGEDDNHYFIVMEYIDGKDLAQRMRTESPFSPERAARVAAGTLDALQHAHSAGVVHRDIKPANIIVTTRVAGSDGTQNEMVKVTDFGIARAVGDSTLTATGSVLGTANYLSPEQASGGTVGPAADQYSTGIVLYEMLVGTVPFTGDSPVAIAMRHMSDDLAAPSTLNPDVPPALDAVVIRATAKEPAGRFPDAQTMASELRRALEPGPVPAAIGAGVVGGDTAVLGGPGDTRPQTLGSRLTGDWNPQRVGRAVLATFAALITIALLLLLFRAFTGDDEPTGTERNRNRGGGGQAVETTPEGQVDPASATIPNDLLGEPIEEARSQLESLELDLKIKEETEPTSEVAPDTVLGVSPEPGTEVFEGDTVTLTKSVEPEEDEGDEDEEDSEHPGKGTPKGPKDKGPKDDD